MHKEAQIQLITALIASHEALYKTMEVVALLADDARTDKPTLSSALDEKVSELSKASDKMVDAMKIMMTAMRRAQ